MGADTDIEELKKLAVVTADENKKIEELDTKIGKLKFQKIPQQIDELKKLIKDFKELKSNIVTAFQGLNDEVSEEVNSIVVLCNKANQLVKKVGAEKFFNENLKSIGSDSWYRFVKDAKDLAKEEEKYSEKPYPHEGDICLLCHQPLDDDAKRLLLKLWAFLEDESKKKAEIVKGTLEIKRRELDNINLDFLNEHFLSQEYLSKNNKILFDKVNSSITGLKKIRSDVYKSIENLNEYHPTDFPENPSLEIKKVINSLIEKQVMSLNHCDISGLASK